MDQWELIRLRCVRDDEPIKRVARELGLAPNTVRKYVRSLIAPQRVQLRRPRRLDGYGAVVDEYLRATPKITAKRIGTLLQERHGCTIAFSERALREFIADRRVRVHPKEAFVRADYQPGDQAQFDFSPMQAIVAGTPTVVHVFAMRLSYSGHFFARAFLHEDRPALFTGLREAITFFGGLPRTAVFDNAKTAVQRVLRGSSREQNPEFRAFCGALALQVEFAAPRRGNEKGGVEGLHGFIEDNVFRPLPSFVDLDELNEALLQFSRKNLERRHGASRELIAQRFARETLRPLPDMLPEPCVHHYARINKFAEITVQSNRYSVPTRFAYRDATIAMYERHLEVWVDGERVAEHTRASGKQQTVINPLHYIELISHKHRSATRALAFAEQRLPAVLIRLRDRLLDEYGSAATKRWTAILRLALGSSLDALANAVEIALARGTLDPHAVALLLHQRGEKPAILHIKHAAPARTAQIVDLAVYSTEALAERAS
ncbi:MAG: IS21 family transposase [Candidatus Baltobacteraceae bacterium]